MSRSGPVPRYPLVLLVLLFAGQAAPATSDLCGDADLPALAGRVVSLPITFDVSVACRLYVDGHRLHRATLATSSPGQLTINGFLIDSSRGLLPATTDSTRLAGVPHFAIRMAMGTPWLTAAAEYAQLCRWSIDMLSDVIHQAWLCGCSCGEITAVAREAAVAMDSLRLLEHPPRISWDAICRSGELRRAQISHGALCWLSVRLSGHGIAFGRDMDASETPGAYSSLHGYVQADARYQATRIYNLVSGVYPNPSVLLIDPGWLRCSGDRVIQQFDEQVAQLCAGEDPEEVSRTGPVQQPDHLRRIQEECRKEKSRLE